MPTYEHSCNMCNYQWEEIYSIKANPPTTCPQCKEESAVRLISGGSGRGVVELTGNELIAKLKADAKTLQKEASKDEKVYANLLGNDRYQSMQTQMDRRGRK